MSDVALASVAVSVIVPMGDRPPVPWSDALSYLSSLDCEVVVVCDAGVDRSEIFASPWEDANRPRITVVRQDRRGKGNAIRAGIRASTGDVIVIVPPDSVAGVADVPLFVATLLLGADFVCGRSTVDWSGRRLPMLRSCMMLGIVGTLSGYRYRGLGHDVTAFWRHVSDQVRFNGDSRAEVLMGIQAAKAHARVVQVPVPPRADDRSDTRLLRALLAEVIRPR